MRLINITGFIHRERTEYVQSREYVESTEYIEDYFSANLGNELMQGAGPYQVDYSEKSCRFLEHVRWMIHHLYKSTRVQYVLIQSIIQAIL